MPRDVGAILQQFAGGVLQLAQMQQNMAVKMAQLDAMEKERQQTAQIQLQRVREQEEAQHQRNINRASGLIKDTFEVQLEAEKERLKGQRTAAEGRQRTAKQNIDLAFRSIGQLTGGRAETGALANLAALSMLVPRERRQDVGRSVDATIAGITESMQAGGGLAPDVRQTLEQTAARLKESISEYDIAREELGRTPTNVDVLGIQQRVFTEFAPRILERLGVSPEEVGITKFDFQPRTPEEQAPVPASTPPPAENDAAVAEPEVVPRAERQKRFAEIRDGIRGRAAELAKELRELRGRMSTSLREARDLKNRQRVEEIKAELQRLQKEERAAEEGLLGTD